MKKLIVTAAVILSVLSVFSQDMTKFKLYSPGENAKEGISAALKKAKESGKHVLVQIGGNWCVWCARFNEFVTNDKSLDSLVNSNYIVYHLNYSKENKNLELLTKYDFPQRFGFPVFLVLNVKGDLLHTQTSWYLESGKSYDKEKVTAFFNDWGPKAFDPAQYKEE
ncbi:MAG: thioredoxin family protein [Chitinophagaceae bacterium]|nr:thioredoxin family protein [Chitinophagaceae bacterium]MBL0130586.1 thioredoxin family protein [Chitinophagaceae bacterium]